MTRPGPLLALDTASPVASVALGDGETVLAEREMAQSDTSRHLMEAIGDCLAQAGCTRRDLAGVLVLRGPGSFTGLRIGLATALAIHESLQVPALAVPTLPVLASSAAATAARPVVACVDALRGEWFCQAFPATSRDSGGVASGNPTLLAQDQLRGFTPACFVGFGVGRWAATLANLGCEFHEPRSLAGPLLRWQARTGATWDAVSLLAPMYLREAAVARGAAPAARTGV